MDPYVLAAITAFAGIAASSGFWTWVNARKSHNKAFQKLLLGLAYDKLVSQGLTYIQQGYISRDEYEDYLKYLYEPYKAFGGNGVAERVMQEVARLPFRSHPRYSEVLQSQGVRHE